MEMDGDVDEGFELRGWAGVSGIEIEIEREKLVWWVGMVG